MSNTIIIRDDSVGKSWEFAPTREGYFQAQAKIDSIEQQGHRVGGDDIGRVTAYTGG